MTPVKTLFWRTHMAEQINLHKFHRERVEAIRERLKNYLEAYEDGKVSEEVVEAREEEPNSPSASRSTS